MLFVSGNSIYEAEGFSQLPQFMRSSATRELKYDESQVSISVVALDIQKKTALISEKIIKNDSLVDFISANYLSAPTAPFLSMVWIGKLKGRAIVEYSSDSVNIVILINVEIPRELAKNFKIFNFTKTGALTDRVSNILKNL